MEYNEGKGNLLFTKKELTIIMGSLIDSIMSRNYEIDEKLYSCEKEHQSLLQETDNLNILAKKISKLINY